MTEENETAATPRIYVASLADYTAGHLLGVWIDATQDASAIRADVNAMLRRSGEPVAEEWAIHDHENFGGLDISEYDDLETIAKAAQLIREHGEVFAGLVNHFGGLSNFDEAADYMADGYFGEFGDVGDYAVHLAEDLYHNELVALPDFIRSNIDWEAIGRDLEMGGDIFTIQVGRVVHVFNSNL